MINGTGTVSADGLTVVSDPGSGIRAPGWHGVAPPGGCGGSGGPPPAPIPPAPTETVNENAAQALAFITGNASGSIFTKTWTAPAPLPGTPPPPPIPGCEVPPHIPGTTQQPFINVTIELDGPLADFAKQTGDLGLVGQAFTLSPGGGSKTLSFNAKTYVEMFGANGIAGLDRDQLYGSKIKITVIEQKTNGDRIRTIDTFYVDRWVDVVDAPLAGTLSGNTAAFMRTNTDGVVRQKNVDLHLSSTPTKFDGPFFGSPFDLSGSVSGVTTAVWKFDPFLSGARSDTFDIVVTDPKSGDLKVGSIVAKGTATNKSSISVDQSGYETELRRVLTSLVNTTSKGADGAPGVVGVDDNGVNGIDDLTELGFAGSDDALVLVYDYGGGVSNQATVGAGGAAGTVKVISSPGKVVVTSAQFKAQFAGFLPGDVYTAAALNAKITAEGNALLVAVTADYSGVSGVTVQAGNFLADVKMSWSDVIFNIGGVPTQVYGAADFDFAKAAVMPLIATTNTTIGTAAKNYALAEALNLSVSNSGQFAVGINTNWSSAATFAQFVANTVSHEVGHTFGLNDAYLFVGGSLPPMDIMRAGLNSDLDLSFGAQNLLLLQAALGVQADGDTPLGTALTLTQTNFNLPNSAAGIRESFGIPIPELGVVAVGRDLIRDDTVDFGTVSSDGSNGDVSTLAFTLSNVGQLPLDLGTLALQNGNAGFRIDNTGLSGSTLAANTSTTLTLVFDPSTVGARGDVLTIASNSSSSPSFSVHLTGTGTSLTPLARVTLSDNNFGGSTVGTAVPGRPNIFSITNDGAQSLVISGIDLGEGTGSFQLIGVPANLGSTPITLTTGQSMSFGASFTPDRLGLQRALINVATNDPTQPNLRLSLVGTGVATLPTVQWGNDFIAVENPELPAIPALRTTSDSAGNFSMFLPASVHFHLAGFDPATGLITHGYGTTAQSGRGTDLTASLVFAASSAKDSDFDGLPDDVEFAIGTNQRGRDTDKDGLDDFTEIGQGLDPLGGLGIPVGIVSASAVQGTAEAVAVIGATGGGNGLTVLVATGTQGLSIIDASQFTTPQALSSLALPGNSSDVAVDPVRNLAVVASNDAGLHIVNISNPSAPVLQQTIGFAAPLTRVEVRDGFAFVATGNALAMVDLNTGDLRQTLDLAAVGGTTLTDIAIEGNFVYTMDASRVLRVIETTGNLLATRGSLSLAAGGGRLFVGGGVAYVGTTDGFAQGFATVNVGNPLLPALLSGVDAVNVAGQALAANGSGLLVNTGNLHYGPGKEQVCEHIALGPEDRNCLKYFAEHGVEIDFRCVPKATAKVNL